MSKCLICNKEIKKRNKYCSPECFHISRRGKPPWNKGKKLHYKVWNKGLKGLEVQPHKKGCKCFRCSKIPWNKGKHFSLEFKKRLSEIRKKGIREGRIKTMEGFKHSEATKEKLSEISKGIRKSPKSEFKKGQSILKHKKGRKCFRCIEGHGYRKEIDKYKNFIIDLYQKGYTCLFISNELNELFNLKVNSRIINKRLVMWKIKMRKGVYGNFILCKDKHKVSSEKERLIDEFLFENGIEHKYNKSIVGYKKGIRYKYDFFIPEIKYYIECWGLTGIEFYDKKKVNKLEVYKKFNLNLIEIEMNDGKKIIHNKLKFLIPLCAKKQKTLF